MARRGSRARRRSKPGRPRNRLVRLARVAIGFATPVHAVLIGLVAAGLLVVVLVEQHAGQVSMIPGVSVAKRTIEAIERYVGPS